MVCESHQTFLRLDLGLYALAYTLPVLAQTMFLSVDGDSDGIIVPHSVAIIVWQPVGVEWLPCLLPCFPYNKDIP